MCRLNDLHPFFDGHICLLFARFTAHFWLVLALGLPLPLFNEWLSIGGKSLVEYTYLFILGYFVFAGILIALGVVIFLAIKNPPKM